MKKRSLFGALTLGLFVAYRRWKRELDEGSGIVQPADLKKVGLSREVFLDLPRLSHHANGRPMEWMNMIVVGDKASVEATLARAGWYKADDVTPWTLLKAFMAIIRKTQYLHGPVTPLFVGNRPHSFGYQKPTEANTFLVRHHTRFWATGRTDSGGAPIWIGHASFDKGIKGTGRFNFPPTHEIDGDIDAERQTLADDLVGAGAKLRGYLQFQAKGEGTNAFDDEFKSDGRAAVIEVQA